MVVYMDPVTNLFAGPVELWLDVAQNISNLARNEFLDVLIRSVVVGAVRNRRFDSEAANPSPNQVVRAGFGGRV